MSAFGVMKPEPTLAVLHMQNKGNEIRWSRKALACHFHFNGLYSWLIWDVFNFEILTVHAAACLINSDRYILPWHIICSIKSFSWRAQHLAFVKWTIWRVCLTTPLQRTDKWFWFSGLKGQIHHFLFFFFRRQFPWYVFVRDKEGWTQRWCSNVS